jgi:hypothetical protein
VVAQVLNAAGQIPDQPEKDVHRGRLHVHSAATKKRVHNAWVEDLDRYAERIPTARNLGEVFKKR